MNDTPERSTGRARRLRRPLRGGGGGGGRRIRSAFGRIPQAIGREGAPLVVLAIVAIVALAAVVIGVNTRRSHEVVGFVEFSVTESGCAIETERSLNATRCLVLGSGSYAFEFSKPLDNTTPIISRSACCPGPAAAAVGENNQVIVHLGRLGRPEVRASLVLP